MKAMEKAKAMLKFNRVYFMWKIFRLIELGLVLILLYWASARLPFAIRISGHYFRRLVTLLASPIFVFLISNLIVFALVFKFRTGQHEIVINGDDRFHLEPENFQVTREAEEIIVYQDKRVIVEEEKVQKKMPSSYSTNSTEKLIKRTPASPTETMICDQKRLDSAKLSLVDELSNDEFQRKIESFIAKQVKFHLQEKSAIVTASSS